jgi:hypothetical protein
VKNITMHEEASAEVAETARYYEERSPGLGFCFLDDVEEALDKVLDNPRAFQLVSEEVRHKRLRRFP